MIDFQEKFNEFLMEKGRGKNIMLIYEEWANTPQDYLNNKTPEKYFEEIEDIGILIEMLKIYKKDIPPLLLRRIKDFKSKAVKELAKLILNENLLNSEENHGVLNGIYIMGEAHYVSAVPYLLKVMEKTSEDSLPFEYSADAIIKIGEGAIEYIIKKIHSAKDVLVCSHFAWLLSRMEKNEIIFQTLSELCKTSPIWNGYYGELLARYGDKRGIDVIRKVALQKKYSFEEHDQFEKALVFLGGEWDWEYEETLEKEKKRREMSENIEMVLIPAGDFIMGSDNDFENEKPLHKVYAESFYIDKYPVTVGQYKEFVRLTGYKSEADRYRPDDFHDNLPITYVSWNDAGAYATWLGKRLPTEAEWEKAARGTDGRTWPWGNEWNKDKLASREGKYTEPVPTGKFPEGISPYGAMDMAGNVWEWTADSEQPYPYKGPYGGNNIKIFRGGAWSHDKKYARCSFRYPGAQDGWANDLGFRCASSVE